MRASRDRMQRQGTTCIKDENFDLPDDNKTAHKPKGAPSKKMLRESDRRIMERAPARRYKAEKIDAKRSERGGWTRRELAEWGVPWPPPKGWRKALLAGENPRSKTALRLVTTRRYPALADPDDYAHVMAGCRAYDGPPPWDE